MKASSYISFFMNTLGKAELTTMIGHIAKVLNIRNTDLQYD